MLWIFEISRYRLALAFKIMFYLFDSRRTSAAAGDGGLTFQTLRQNMLQSLETLNPTERQSRSEILEASEG